jgi:hypothetical protein
MKYNFIDKIDYLKKISKKWLLSEIYFINKIMKKIFLKTKTIFLKYYHKLNKPSFNFFWILRFIFDLV